MTKEELNEKLAELYGEDGGYEIVNENKYSDSITTLLIDDSARMFELAIEQKLAIAHVIDYGSGEFYAVDVTSRKSNECAEYQYHESPLAAALHAIALALVKLAESKS